MLSSLSRKTGNELAHLGVTANAITPGLVDTAVFSRT
jgi:NAD(P)-dependent dehydrogenase (short-subunit alcohol dehydrogenase family)